MREPLVSVIMANFNTPVDYIKEAVDSVICQTYSNFELIIVDDCSNERDSVEYIKKL